MNFKDSVMTLIRGIYLPSSEIACSSIWRRCIL